MLLVPIQSLETLIEKIDLRGRRVFVRADLNVPLKDGRITDDSRIRASLPTLERLRDAGARILLASHLGRPKGQRVPELSLEPVATALAGRLDCPVHFVGDCIGDEVEAAAARLADGGILLLENLRFHAGETANDPDFARALARLADTYVNDAFGTAHRAHASTAGMVPFIDHVAAGLLMQKELDALGAALHPERPFVCFLGGAKVSDKLGVLEALIERAETIGVGGAMAYTFLLARGESVGRSLVEPERLDDAKRMLARADERDCRLMLPSDHVVCDRLENPTAIRTVETIPEDMMGVDIGPETAERYAEAALAGRTILWNGPMGIFEIDAFSKGTERLARAVAASKGRSIVGGGDSLAAVNKVGVARDIDHLSTGGGASLEFVQGLTLPGIAALDRPE
ncbi:MAG TPA: phosphoglycerate kinase [Deltaproteobacteria bacterium]|nr:phosphoglycerate kinase [Deltaproteobacteria bacterium]